MKLLFDNNLSHKLVQRLSDIFPGSSHVMREQLDESNDQEIWLFARKNGFTIVTKDSDFNELRLLQGFPPKVI
jgi:predicted nuclease of predicted toxin-antitoxin system